MPARTLLVESTPGRLSVLRESRDRPRSGVRIAAGLTGAAGIRLPSVADRWPTLAETNVAARARRVALARVRSADLALGMQICPAIEETGKLSR